VTARLPAITLAALALCRPLAAQDTAHLVIAATTDVHGAVTAWDYVADRAASGGLTRAAHVVDSLRDAYPGAVVLLDAGDFLEGNLFAARFAEPRPGRIHPVVDAMNAMGYDAATPGNHEFDFGLAPFSRARDDAGFAIVSGNIVALPEDTLALTPYVVVRRAGVRVGVTGFTTPGVMVWDGDQLAGRLVVHRVEDAAAATLRAVRAGGADVVVVLAHTGLDGASSYDTSGVGAEHVAAELARLPDRPDLVIVGHSHRPLRDSVIEGVHFVQPRARAQSVAVVHVWLVAGQRGSYRVVRIAADEVVLGDTPEEPALAQRVRDAHEDVRAWAGQPIGVAEGDWRAREARAQDTPVIDFVNAVQRRAAGAQLSATPVFDTRAGFGPGVIRLRDIAGLYPYYNTLRAVRIDGEQLRRYLEQSARYFRTYRAGEPVIATAVPGYDFDIVSGARYDIDLSQPVGARIRALTVGGRPVAVTDTFTLALNSYRQAGGGGFTMLAALPVVYRGSRSVRDLLVDAVRAAGTLRPEDVFEPSWRLQPDDAQRAVLAVFSPPPPARDTVLVRILATNDVHGTLEPSTPDWSGGRPVGGAAVTKARMDWLTAECDCPTIRLDAGDAFQGTAISNLSYGRAVVDAYNAMGYDAVALGNHEFDWTIDTLRARIAESRFPWLAANLVERASGRAPAWVRRWTMIERGGRRIAVIGAITPGTTTLTNPSNVAALAFGDPAAAVRDVLPAVRAAGADVILVLAHLGAHCDGGCSGASIDLAQSLDAASVDAVLGGHTPDQLTETVRGVLVAQVRHGGGEIAVVDVVRRADGRREVQARIDTVWADAAHPDTVVRRVVEGYTAAAARVANRVVARLQTAAARSDRGESPLGRLIADGFRNGARADVALVNDGAIRADLPAGPVTYGQVFRVMPFRNQLMRVTVTGAELRAVLEFALAGPSPRADVAGIVVRYDPGRAPGRRVQDVRLADGRRLDGRRSYTLAVPDFLVAGGDAYTMLVGRPVVPAGITDLDALARYLGLLPQPVAPPTAARLVPSR
jgi:2',3'-cyclic-nucleotide 2'-phosphodiesterase/3'-nucleotidase/5'-nucleotidase